MGPDKVAMTGLGIQGDSFSPTLKGRGTEPDNKNRGFQVGDEQFPWEYSDACQECGLDLSRANRDHAGRLTVMVGQEEYSLDHCPRCGVVLVRKEASAVLS